MITVAWRACSVITLCKTSHHPCVRPMSKTVSALLQDIRLLGETQFEVVTANDIAAKKLGSYLPLALAAARRDAERATPE